MTETQDRYAFSLGGEFYTGDYLSRAEAYAAALECNPEASWIFIGKKVPYTVEDFIPEDLLDVIMYQMNHEAVIYCKEFCDSWPNTINIPDPEVRSAVKAIHNVLTVLLRNNQPPCFKVTDVQEFRS